MPRCADDLIEIPRGNNRWVLARTDRDAPTLDDVLESSGAFLGRVLGQASPFGQRNIFEHLPAPGGPKLPENEERFVIGAARPVLVRAEQPETASEALDLVRPEGNLIARHSDCPTLRTVRAERPWIVAVDFDWRGQSTTAPWPRHGVNAFGLPTDDPNDLDWLLLGASHTGLAKSKDTTLMREVSDETAKQIKRAASASLKYLAGAAVVGGVAWWMLKGRKPRKRGKAA